MVATVIIGMVVVRFLNQLVDFKSGVDSVKSGSHSHKVVARVIGMTLAIMGLVKMVAIVIVMVM